MNRPTRDTASGRAYLDLRKLARARGRGTDELLVLYVLERFLYRVSVSEHRERLVLKGGMLLAAFDQRRPTRDVDLLAMTLSNEVEAARPHRHLRRHVSQLMSGNWQAAGQMCRRDRRS